MIRVVIADDQKFVIDRFRSSLQNEQDISIVDDANNGLELIRSVERNEPDVVLTDIRMPGMDGITATEYLSDKFPDIPVLALSNPGQNAEITAMMDAGASGFLPKKAKKNQVVDAVRKFTKQGRTHRMAISKKIKTRLRDNSSLHRPSTLTRRELEILSILAKGKTSKEIAGLLGISKFTVDTHRKNIHKKLGIRSNTGLVRYALENSI